MVDVGSSIEGVWSGGIVGSAPFLTNGSNATENRIENCHAHGTVAVFREMQNPGNVAHAAAGGILGTDTWDQPAPDPLFVDAVYSDVTLAGPGVHGGIVGHLVGLPPITNAYFDSAAAGTTLSAGGATAVAANALQSSTTFVGFDFTNTWRAPNAAPPRLLWE